ncbi:MAG: flagellar FliJ family protein [Alphaproteobacteria bacterium]|jgi:flagellar export protein FliJ|nr:flagellar FliJ family protein [Alphaproteobacteria bacterium]MDP6833105.1 flagellar FliJ family protein [Alphaproteobacteria bacterium]MDP6876341.1 flagellar FliJ family protein [Alphaproteobacteria bacterium]
MNVRGFDALARMHRFRMDEHRRKAAEIEAMRRQFMQQDSVLEQELHQEIGALGLSEMAMIDFAAYSKGIETRREKLAKSIVEASRALEQINEKMAAEFREAKKFELALEREAKRRGQLAARLEQAELDEIGVNYHDRAPA